MLDEIMDSIFQFGLIQKKSSSCAQRIFWDDKWNVVSGNNLKSQNHSLFELRC